ncbi:MAG: helix-turn-helix transcriptional regulator [Salinivirgaceae bacterium]
MSISHRIAYIQEQEGLSATAFADAIGVQRSGLSHIYSDRNKPSIDFIQKLIKAFPTYRVEWLLNGHEPILKQMNTSPNAEPLSSGKPEQPKTLFDMVESEPPATYGDKPRPKLEPKIENNEEISQKAPNKPSSARQLQKIIMVYSDDTFKVIVPQ